MYDEYLMLVDAFQVLDIVIHRFLELPPVGKSLENILEHLGGLYKFHGEHTAMIAPSSFFVYQQLSFV